MPLPRSLRNRLALIFFGITASAILGIYAYVVPQLESSLQAQKLRSLAAAARHYSADLERQIGANVPQSEVERLVRRIADRSDRRVTLFDVVDGTQGVQVHLNSDSSTGSPAKQARFLVALAAAGSRRAMTATEPTGGGRLAEAAQPLIYRGKGRRRYVARVAVYSAPLDDVAANVALVRRKIVIAGAVAGLLAALAGYLVASSLSRRVKRLERAADAVAAGDFSHAIPVESDDEIGQLAIAFNDMQAQLARMDDARRQFIATASHELRTPIFSLSGFTELLVDEELDEETRRAFLRQLSDQITRLTKLTTELLDLSKLDSGSLDLRATRIEITDLTRSVTAEFAPALTQHDSQLELHLPSSGLHAQGDPERVAQILRILIDNVIAHTPTGTRIRVSARAANGGVSLAVRDDGQGIRRADLPQVFEPFYTSDDTRGSGLGLAIARELAHRMRGQLAVDSVPGRTIFTLELPN